MNDGSNNSDNIMDGESEGAAYPFAPPFAAVSGAGYLAEDEVTDQLTERLEGVLQRLAVPRMVHVNVAPLTLLLSPPLHPLLCASLLGTWLVCNGHRHVNAFVAVCAV